MKSYGWILGVVLIVLLSACGGGGGGGSAGPANVTDPAPPIVDLQTGLFTDSPVTGLRYVQGHREGYTENGIFQYDANRSEPVCFYIGSILLGCAGGANVVTPYNLFSAGSPASLQSGYNISRLLISLDDSADSGIQLSGTTRSAQGGVDFFLSDGMFATDEVVEELIAQYAPLGSLVSRSDVDAHVADNADVQQAIQNLNQVLSQSIAGISITWDSSLNGQGILAHIEARSAVSPSSYEHLYLELDTQGDDLYLSQLTYVTTSGDYTSVELNSQGIPANVYQEGKAHVFLNMRNTRLEDWIVTSSYRPQQIGYLIDSRGYEARTEARFITESRSKELVDIVAMVLDTGITDAAMLRLSAAAAGVINSVKCAGDNNATCGTHLEEALVYAMADNSYAQSVIDWNYASLSYDLCLPLNIGTSDQNCGFAPNLSQFNVVVEQAIQSFNLGEKWVRSPDAWDSVATFYLEYPVGDFLLIFGRQCFIDGELEEMGGGSYYLSYRLQAESCQQLSDPYAQEYGETCFPIPDGVQVLDYTCDMPSMMRPGDWELQKALANKVFDRLLSSGMGMPLVEASVRNEERTYHDEDTANHFDDHGWYLNISNGDRFSNSDYHYDFFAPWISPFSSSEVLGRGVFWSQLQVDSVYGYATAYGMVEGVYEDKDGTQITLTITTKSEYIKE